MFSSSVMLIDFPEASTSSWNPPLIVRPLKSACLSPIAFIVYGPLILLVLTSTKMLLTSVTSVVETTLYSLTLIASAPAMLSSFISFNIS